MHCFDGHVGEHIDYALFGVIPSAIERDVLMAVGPQEAGEDAGRVTAQNMDIKYTRETFAPERGAGGSWTLDIDKTQLRWESYVKAGYYVRPYIRYSSLGSQHITDSSPGRA